MQRSLGWCEGMASHPGIRRRVYFCSKSLIVAYPQLKRDEFGRPVSSVTVGDFELVDGAYFQHIDINIDKSTVTSDPQGEAPSQTQLNKAVLFHNGTDEDATGAPGWLNNSDNVYLVEDMLGRFRIVGNDKWRTKTTVKQDLGQGTNAAGTTIEVECTDEVAPPFYNGAIETEAGTVYCDMEAVDEDSEETPSVTPTSVMLQLVDGSEKQTKQLIVRPETGWTFTSDDDTIATVSEAGLITGLAQGRTTITCVNGDYTRTVNVNVTRTVPLNG